MSRPPRLPFHDYRSAAGYFVTFCCANRRRLLSTIAAGRVSPTSLGRIVADAWASLPKWFPAVTVDAFVVMPDHAHGILFLESEDAATRSRGADQGPAAGPDPGSVGAIVGTLKSRSSRLARSRTLLSGPLWQRGFYERVIRTPRELAAFRRYIDENPRRWKT